jgi:hypothetical protein
MLRKWNDNTHRCVCAGLSADEPDPTIAADHTTDTKPARDQSKKPAHAVAIKSASSASSNESHVGSGATEFIQGPAGPNSLCPVVAFASFAAQLSFKMVLHLAVFGGGCGG